jgi:predicted ATPase
MTLRISSIEVRNFKSLVDFKIDLAKFSCLIGLNGAGKSTVLQFLDFVSHLIRGDVTDWLDKRRWKSADLRSKLTLKRNIEFTLRFRDADGQPAGRWEAHFNPSSNRCTYERIDSLTSLLTVVKDEIQVQPLGSRNSEKKSWTTELTFSYEGSILSSLKEALLPKSILAFKRFLASFESLDMLTPDSLRQQTRTANGSLGHGGRNLSAFVYELGLPERTSLTSKLKRAYPQVRRIRSKSLRSGWKQLQVVEKFEDETLTTEARHLNDGMLRLIAVFAELASDHGFVLFDEIENGINPELVEFVINRLVNARQQVLVTTHSPMILNYLDDEAARAGVIYLYRTPDGATRSFPFFSIPSVAEKLEVMGPGEVFVDTHLTELADEIVAVAEEA